MDTVWQVRPCSETVYQSWCRMPGCMSDAGRPTISLQMLALSDERRGSCWSSLAPCSPAMCSHGRRHRLLLPMTKSALCQQVAEALRAQQPQVLRNILLALKRPAAKCQKQQALDLMVGGSSHVDNKNRIKLCRAWRLTAAKQLVDIPGTGLIPASW